MRIEQLLIVEDFNFDSEGHRIAPSTPSNVPAIKIAPSDLNSLQIRTINRLKNGQVDIETASNKELAVIYDLIDLGLVDSDGNVIDEPFKSEPEIGRIQPHDSIELPTDDGTDDSDIDFTIGR